MRRRRRPAVLAAAVFSTTIAPSGLHAQDAPPDSPSVVPLVVTGVVPIPDIGQGAPQFSADELTVRRDVARKEARAFSDCQRKADGVIPRVLFNVLAKDARERERLLVKAQAATLAAETVRTEAAKGLRTQAEVETAELARQAAVNAFVNQPKATSADADAMDLRASRPGRNPSMAPLVDGLARVVDERLKLYQDARGTSAAPSYYADLRIQGVTLSQDEDEAGGFFLIKGEVVNPRRSTIPMPPLSFLVFDKHGLELDRHSTWPERTARIGPGASRPFQFAIRPSLRYATTVRVTFNNFMVFSDVRQGTACLPR